MMKSFHIQWVETDPTYLADEHYAQFFLLVRNGRIVYIGDSFHRSLQELIPATLRAAGLNENSTQIFLGRIVEFSGLKNQDVNEIHRLLVYARKPLYNLNGKHDFKAENTLVVHNSGSGIFPLSIKANDDGVFLSQKLAARVNAVA